MYNNEIIQSDLAYIVKDINFKKLKNKTVLITGASGMLASYYLCSLIYLNDNFNYNIEIFALVRDKEHLLKKIGIENREDIKIVEQDVCDNINIDEKIDYIIHMASSSNPKSITENPVGIIKANVIGTLNILELAKKNNAEVIFTSTREIYGDMKDVEIIKEDDMGILNNIQLRSCYPESKRMAENLIVSYSYQYNIRYKIARIAHSYGPGMIVKNDGRIMSDLLSNVLDKKDIILKSDGKAKRAFCYVADAIKGLLIITVSNNKNEVYNLANETEEIEIKELAENLTKWYSEYNIKLEYRIENNSNKYVNFKRTKLSTGKLEKLGWKPEINLRDGITRTINFFEGENI